MFINSIINQIQQNPDKAFYLIIFLNVLLTHYFLRISALEKQCCQVYVTKRFDEPQLTREQEEKIHQHIKEIEKIKKGEN